MIGFLYLIPRIDFGKNAEETRKNMIAQKRRDDAIIAATPAPAPVPQPQKNEKSEKMTNDVKEIFSDGVMTVIIVCPMCDDYEKNKTYLSEKKDTEESGLLYVGTLND